MTSEIEINVMPGIWQHYKGDLYEVLGTAKHTETFEELVVYKKLGEDKLWVRPVSMFIEAMPNSGSRFWKLN